MCEEIVEKLVKIGYRVALYLALLFAGNTHAHLHTRCIVRGNLAKKTLAEKLQTLLLLNYDR